MNSDFSQSGSHSLHPDLQELVNRFGMDSGAVEVVIHEGSIQFLDVKPEYRLYFRDEDDAADTPQVESISLHEAKRFVRSRLERKLFEQTGQFGHVMVKVKNGIVFDWHFTRRHKFTKSGGACR